MTTSTGPAQHDPAARATGRGPRRLLLALLAALTVSLGLLVPAAPASAATSYGIADICFQAPYTLYGTTYWGAYNRPVVLDVWLDGRAQAATTLTPGTNGCLRAALVAGWSWRFRVYHHEAGTYYVGRSAWTWAYAGSYAYLGTLRLSAVRG